MVIFCGKEVIIDKALPDKFFWISGDQVHCTKRGRDTMLVPPDPTNTGYPYTSNGNGWAMRNG